MGYCNRVTSTAIAEAGRRVAPGVARPNTPLRDRLPKSGRRHSNAKARRTCQVGIASCTHYPEGVMHLYTFLGSRKILHFVMWSQLRFETVAVCKASGNARLPPRVDSSAKPIPEGARSARGRLSAISLIERLAVIARKE